MDPAGKKPRPGVGSCPHFFYCSYSGEGVRWGLPVSHTACEMVTAATLLLPQGEVQQQSPNPAGLPCFGSAAPQSDKQTSQTSYSPCFLLVWGWGWRNCARRDFLWLWQVVRSVIPQKCHPVLVAQAHLSYWSDGALL